MHGDVNGFNTNKRYSKGLHYYYLTILNNIYFIGMKIEVVNLLHNGS